MNPNIYSVNQATASANANTNIQTLGNFDWQTALVPFDATVTPFPDKYWDMSSEHREYCIDEFTNFKRNMANPCHRWHSRRGLISRGAKATWRSLPHTTLQFHWDARGGADYSCYSNQHDVVIMHIFDDYLSPEDVYRCTRRGQLAEMLARQLGDVLDLIVSNPRGSNSSSETSLVPMLNGLTTED